MNGLDALIEWIQKANDIAIVPHVNPDGDALGSGLALVRILQRLGKRSALVVAETPAGMYAFLPDFDAIAHPKALMFEPAAILFEDVASVERRADRGAQKLTGLPSAQLDHHATNTRFCDVNWIDGDAPATGILVLRLMARLAMPLDREMATLLYTAIATDTGNFSYANTNAEAARGLALLLETGFDLEGCNRRLFRLRSEGRTRLLGVVLSRLKRELNGRVAWSYLNKEDWIRCGAVRADTEGAVSFLNEIDGVQACFLAEERPEEGVIKFSFRSNGAVDVSKAAAALGGGGHRQAAGASIPMPMDDAIATVLKELRGAVEKIAASI